MDGVWNAGGWSRPHAAAAVKFRQRAEPIRAALGFGCDLGVDQIIELLKVGFGE